MNNDKLIAEQNIVIAEFMGLHFHKIGWVDSTHIDGNYECEQLQYHTSWEWIMPVVEKISKHVIKGLAPFNSDQYVRIEIVSNGYVKITNLRDMPIFANASVEGSTLLAVYSAVLQFLTWHNANKTNSHEPNHNRHIRKA